MSEVLVVDDEPGIRELVREILQDEGYEVVLAENGEQARQIKASRRVDCVLLDIWMPDVDGMTLLKEWAGNGGLDVPVVMMSGHGTLHTAVEATRLGAFDFLEKPVPYGKLLATIERALAHKPGRKALPIHLDELGQGSAVRLLVQRLTQAAAIDTPILLLGEPGSGAEICARFLHFAGTPWLAPEEFGGLADRPLEWLAQAKGGVLFLREVGDLARLQQKGLALLLNRRHEFGVRVICATTHNLSSQVAEGQFSPELYQALAQVTIRVPALRDRREDIVVLLETELSRVQAAHRLQLRSFTPEALERLAAYDWPGNLSELKTVVHSLAITGHGDSVGFDEVRAVLPGLPAADEVAGSAELRLDLPLKESREQFERRYLEAMLVLCDGNIRAVADRAGLERTHLYRKLGQLGIELPRKGN